MSTNNRAKQELQKIRNIDRMIDSLIEEKAMTWSQATKVTAQADGSPGGGNSYQDSMAEAIARIIEMEKEIAALIDEFVERKNYWRKLALQLGNNTFFEVLHRRYFLYKSWSEIAEDLSCGERNVLIIHGKALQVLNEMIDKED